MFVSVIARSLGAPITWVHGLVVFAWVHGLVAAALAPAIWTRLEEMYLKTISLRLCFTPDSFLCLSDVILSIRIVHGQREA